MALTLPAPAAISRFISVYHLLTTPFFVSRPPFRDPFHPSSCPLGTSFPSLAHKPRRVTHTWLLPTPRQRLPGHILVLFPHVPRDAPRRHQSRRPRTPIRRHALQPVSLIPTSSVTWFPMAYISIFGIWAFWEPLGPSHHLGPRTTRFSGTHLLIALPFQLCPLDLNNRSLARGSHRTSRRCLIRCILLVVIHLYSVTARSMNSRRRCASGRKLIQRRRIALQYVEQDCFLFMTRTCAPSTVLRRDYKSRPCGVRNMRTPRYDAYLV